MEECYDIWNIFHDGEIEQIEGTIPGPIRIRVGIEYIRHMFSEDGGSVWVNLIECSRLQYEPWDESPIVCDFSEIEKLKPRILSTKYQENGDLLIYAVDGNIRTKYKNATYELDNGNEVAFEELDRACEKYWDHWERQKP